MRLITIITMTECLSNNNTLFEFMKMRRLPVFSQVQRITIMEVIVESCYE